MSTARNASCPCGSGKRYKECCGQLHAPAHGTPPTAEAVIAFNAANELARAGRLEAAQAAYERLVGAQGEFAEAHANLGELLLQQGRFEAAAASCARAIALNPQLAQAHHSLGNAQLRLHRMEEALASYARALALKPDYLDAHVNLACALRSIGRLAAAEQCLLRALELDPRRAAVHVELATVLRLSRRVQECERSCHQALALQPESAGALAVLAELRADLGDFDQARQLHQRILAADPESLESLVALARLKRMSVHDAQWLAAAQRLAMGQWPPQRERLLHYALGKFHDDTGDFDQAFRHYRRANELSQRCAPPHDSGVMARTVDAILNSQDRAWVGSRRCAGNDSARPVFIVGMLRSGTTLAEQILASHPEVHGAGELSFWSSECAAAYARTAHTQAALEFSCDEVARLGSAYLALLQALAPESARVVDKFPANFFFMGLIHAALPQARFIHMRRDPRDTCLSIYFQQFESANSYANDLEHLAQYHRDYRRLMQHWGHILPRESLLQVPYEGLVEDTEAWSRAMLEFVGLPWDARCLDFHRSARPVTTASRWQVRQGISSASLQRWRHYADHLGPLAALRPE